MSKILVLYTDADNELSETNIFLSTPYDDLRQFERENEDDNFKSLVTYNLDDVLGLNKK